MAATEIPDEAKQAQSVVEAVLGDSIIGIYLFGSAVAGGLKRDSDVPIGARGFSNTLMKLTIEKAMQHGIREINIRCHKHNEPSARMIKANGVSREAAIRDDGKVVQRYMTIAPYHRKQYGPSGPVVAEI